jgi:hypothetical protein
MPANVSENIRPIATAGFANEVELVNQYAAPMYAPTAAADRAARPVRARVKIRAISPAVATTSDKSGIGISTRWCRAGARQPSGLVLIVHHAPPIDPGGLAGSINFCRHTQISDHERPGGSGSVNIQSLAVGIAFRRSYHVNC